MMKRQSVHIILAAFVLTCSACATMFNSKKTSFTVEISEPSNLVINQDTIKNTTSGLFSVARDNKPLIITAFNDSLTKTVSVKPKNSFAYYLNAYPNWHLWTGFYIDTKTKKRYTYPKKIYIDLSRGDSSYLTYIPLKNPYDMYSSILKITPFKTIGLVYPSIELSYERKTGRSLSTQVVASYLLPESAILIYMGNEFRQAIKGYDLSIEERFYFKKSALIGPYSSFEFRYLNNQYKDVWSFGVGDIYSDTTYNFTNYPDTFGIKKQTYSFNFKLGYQLIVRRLSVDFYAGFGLRYKDVTHFDRINPMDEMEIPMHPNIHYFTNIEGKYWTVSIPLNLRVGWTF